MNIDFKLPELGENVHSADVVNLLVREGDTIAANDGVLELETDKAVVELPCPHAGRVVKLHVKKGDTVNVGQTLLTLAAEKAPAQAAAPPSPATAPQPAKATASKTTAPEPAAPEASVSAQPGGVLPAGPTVRRLARELGVDLAQLKGSGKHGQITVEDVQKVAAPSPAAPSGEAAPPLPGEPGKDDWGPVRIERMPRIRRTIAEQMSRAASIIPHVTNFDDADVTDLEQLRQGVPAGRLGPNVKLTLLPFVMKAVAAILPQHPLLGASLDMEREQIVYKDYVNLGLAVDTPRGLVVPVVRNAHRLGLADLARAVATIADRARRSQFAVEELRGGTFTISNLGAVGGLYSTPIINYPEVALLLLGRARWMPVVRGPNHDRIETRLMLPLSLSYDHRLVDGAAAGRFLNQVIRTLEAPGELLL